VKAAVELRVALLGYGAIAGQHAVALRELGCTLAAVVGPNLERANEFARTHEVRRVGALDDVIGADDVDAIVVASPNGVHAEQAIAALRAGHDVLCEVPLAMSLADAESIAAVAEETGRGVMVCHTQRYWPPIAELHGLVASGRLDLLHVISRTCMPRRENVGWTGRPRTWVDSAVWHHGSHLVDTALWLLGGEVEHVTALAGRPHPRTGAPMDVSIALRTSSGSLASLVLSYNSALRISDGVFIGEQDSYRSDGGMLASSSGLVVDVGSPEAAQERAVLAQDGAFVRAVLGGAPAEPTAASVQPVYAVLQQVHDLLETGA
jgi:2-hydroxy-4-carboxymuconate semialdehyde hemiacetal dehydrogenase